MTPSPISFVLATYAPMPVFLYRLLYYALVEILHYIGCEIKNVLSCILFLCFEGKFAP